jgi:hypothetical protein
MSTLQLLDAAGRPPLAGDTAWVSRRTSAAQQGVSLPARPASGRGDRRRHAPGRRVRPRLAPAGADRRALAHRPPDRRGDGPDRTRPRLGPRLAPGPPGQGRQAPRGRHGRLGLRPAPALARPPGRNASRNALLRDRRPDARKALDPRRRTQPPAPVWPRPVCAVASPLTSCATRTQSRWPAKVSRSR